GEARRAELKCVEDVNVMAFLEQHRYQDRADVACTAGDEYSGCHGAVLPRMLRRPMCSGEPGSCPFAGNAAEGGVLIAEADRPVKASARAAGRAAAQPVSFGLTGIFPGCIESAPHYIGYEDFSSTSPFQCAASACSRSRGHRECQPATRCLL